MKKRALDWGTLRDAAVITPGLLIPHIAPLAGAYAGNRIGEYFDPSPRVDISPDELKAMPDSELLHKVLTEHGDHPSIGNIRKVLRNGDEIAQNRAAKRLRSEISSGQNYHHSTGSTLGGLAGAIGGLLGGHALSDAYLDHVAVPLLNKAYGYAHYEGPSGGTGGWGRGPGGQGDSDGGPGFNSSGPQPSWEDLGLKGDEDMATAQSAFRAASRRHHPDVGGSKEDFQRMNAAWENIQKSKKWGKFASLLFAAAFGMEKTARFFSMLKEKTGMDTMVQPPKLPATPAMPKPTMAKAKKLPRVSVSGETSNQSPSPMKYSSVLYTLAVAGLMKEAFTGLGSLIGSVRGYQDAPEERKGEGFIRGAIGGEGGSALGMMAGGALGGLPGFLTGNNELRDIGGGAGMVAGGVLGGVKGYQALMDPLQKAHAEDMQRREQLEALLAQRGQGQQEHTASVLSTEDREAIPKSNFAIPSKADNNAEQAQSGNYPIHDLAHARNALARSSGKPVEGQVRAAVYAKYPQLKKAFEIEDLINDFLKE